MKKKWLCSLTGLLFCIIVSAQSFTAKLEEVVAAYNNNYQFNGAVLVASKGNILLQKGYGFKNVAANKKNDENTIFQIGSITKQFTGLLILQLQEQGKLSVDDKLSKYYPSISWAEKITIEQLLTHTSGIYNYTKDSLFMARDAVHPTNETTILSLFKDRPLEFEPGTKWSYSNSGYMLLGYIIEKVTGKPYERVAHEMIFRPLNMNHTGFDFKSLQSADKATGYDEYAPRKVEVAGIVDSTVSFAAGAIYTTVGDLYLWDRALYTTKLLQTSSLLKAYTPYPNFKYGYGWGIDSLFGNKVVKHGGGIFGFSTYILRMLNDETVVIVLDNTSNGGLGGLATNLAAVVSGKPLQLPTFRKEIKLEDVVLKQYVGEYQLAPDFSITVTLENNQLRTQATGQSVFDIFPEKENYFFLKVIDAQITFLKDEKGKVDRLILHQGGMNTPGKKIK